MCVCIYYSPHFIFFIQCSLILPFDPLLGHDFLHVYKKIISQMLAEVLQSEGSHKMEFDGVQHIMIFTLPFCQLKIALCFLILCCCLVPFVF